MSEEELQHPDLVDEYLRSLQGQVDDLRARNKRLKKRIARLEAEAETLRSLVPRRRRPTRAGTRSAPDADRSVTIPGIGSIPDLDLPESPVVRPDLRVAVVLDAFSLATFRYEFDAVEVPSAGWESALEQAPPRFLFVESAYSGMERSWAGLIARFGEPSEELVQLVDWCRKRRIPTVFWNKEDPINHDWFTASASLFDHVFTVDSNMVGRYRSRLGHGRVGVLQFSAQPVIHHPPGEEAMRTGEVAFAGSYYASKHPERRAQMEMLLDAAVHHGLHIFDRMDRQADSRFAWPEKYRAHLVGSLTYPQTLEAYRRYKTFINVNTVVDSPTMCARRVYELLASGTRVVSGPSLALEGVPVEIASSTEEARALLAKTDDGLAADRVAWARAGNLTGHRVDTILEAIG